MLLAVRTAVRCAGKPPQCFICSKILVTPVQSVVQYVGCCTCTPCLGISFMSSKVFFLQRAPAISPATLEVKDKPACNRSPRCISTNWFILPCAIFVHECSGMPLRFQIRARLPLTNANVPQRTIHTPDTLSYMTMISTVSWRRSVSVLC